MKYAIAAAFVFASTAFAEPAKCSDFVDSDGVAPYEEEYGIYIPDIYPYDETVGLLMYEPAADAYAGDLTIACSERLQNVNLVTSAFDDTFDVDCSLEGGAFMGIEFNVTGLTPFTDIDTDFVTEYIVDCTVSQANDPFLVLLTKSKNFTVTVENNVVISIEAGQVTTEAEESSSDTTTLGLDDILSVSVNGGDAIVIEEGRLSRMLFAFEDKRDDTAGKASYEITSINDLKFIFQDDNSELAITTSEGDETSNAIANSIDYEPIEDAKAAELTLLVPAGFITDTVRQVTMTGSMTAGLLGRRRDVFRDEPVNFEGRFTLSQSTVSAGVSTAVSFITMMGVPATLVAAAGLF